MKTKSMLDFSYSLLKINAIEYTLFIWLIDSRNQHCWLNKLVKEFLILKKLCISF